MTIRETKAWLMRYQKAKKEAEDIEWRLIQLRHKYALPSAIRYSDMPKAQGTSDLSDFMAQLEEYENLLIDKYKECMGIEVEIYTAVDKLKEEDERRVLRYKYIDGDTWRVVADKIPCSMRSVYNIRDKAVNHLKDCIVLHH